MIRQSYDANSSSKDILDEIYMRTMIESWETLKVLKHAVLKYTVHRP